MRMENVKANQINVNPVHIGKDTDPNICLASLQSDPQVQMKGA